MSIHLQSTDISTVRSTQVAGAGQVVGVLDSTLASCVMELSPGPDNTTRIMSGRTSTRYYGEDRVL